MHCHIIRMQEGAAERSQRRTRFTIVCLRWALHACKLKWLSNSCTVVQLDHLQKLLPGQQGQAVVVAAPTTAPPAVSGAPGAHCTLSHFPMAHACRCPRGSRRHRWSSGCPSRWGGPRRTHRPP